MMINIHDMIMIKVFLQYTVEYGFFNPPDMGGSTEMEAEIGLHDIRAML